MVTVARFGVQLIYITWTGYINYKRKLFVLFAQKTDLLTLDP